MFPDRGARSTKMAGKVLTHRRRRGSCKCLFGAPDRDETRRLMAEQHNRDRRRFIRRFDFDIDSERSPKEARFDSPVRFPDSAADALANIGNTDLCVPMLGSPRRSPKSGESPRTPRTPRTPRGTRTPRTPRTPASRRQLHMTDYWTVRKRSESASSDKEN